MEVRMTWRMLILAILLILLIAQAAAGHLEVA